MRSGPTLTPTLSVNWSVHSPTAFREGFNDIRTGHRSIVNATAVHPYMLHVVTAGIERNIILHSPTPSSPCTQNLARTPVETRVLSDDSESDRVTYFRALSGTPTRNVGDRDPDSTAISLFDQ